MTGTPLPSLAGLATSDMPFAILARDSATVEVLTGEVIDVELLRAEQAICPRSPRHLRTISP